jgi:DNA-binding MarR family transcriptional regulator
MATIAGREVSTKLLLLKDLDSVVDFSRASNQFTIILWLAEQSELVPVGEVARFVGDTRKSVLDSLRKLEKKGLIHKLEKNGELYVGLSERGRAFVKKLLDLLSPAREPGEVLDTPVRLNISKELVTSINLYRLIVHAGLSRKGYLTLEEASRLVIDGGRDINVILESFTRNPTRFFKIAKHKGRDVIMLDKQGVEVLKKTPHYKVFQENPIYRLSVVLTGSPWAREIAGKLNTFLGVIATGSIASAILFKSFIPLAIGIGSATMIIGLNLVFARLGFIDAE